MRCTRRPFPCRPLLGPTGGSGRQPPRPSVDLKECLLYCEVIARIEAWINKNHFLRAGGVVPLRSRCFVFLNEIRILEDDKLTAVHPVLEGRGQRRIAGGHRTAPPPANSTTLREAPSPTVTAGTVVTPTLGWVPSGCSKSQPSQSPEQHCHGGRNALSKSANAMPTVVAEDAAFFRATLSASASPGASPSPVDHGDDGRDRDHEKHELEVPISAVGRNTKDAFDEVHRNPPIQ
jgi:hypothetical protein